jgi:hypothetical protein
VIAVRTIAITAMVILVAALASAQTNRGEIRGTLSGARGPLAGVEVRVKNTETGELTVATTSSNGEFVVTVAPGSYEVFSSPVGYTAFAARQLVVQAGSTTRANGELGDNPNAGTPGEIPFLYQRALRREPLTASPI